MAFSVFVEMLNLRLRQITADPVKLRAAYVEEAAKNEVKEPDQKK
jgi:hypothetical protein